MGNRGSTPSTYSVGFLLIPFKFILQIKNKGTLFRMNARTLRAASEYYGLENTIRLQYAANVELNFQSVRITIATKLPAPSDNEQENPCP